MLCGRYRTYGVCIALCILDVIAINFNLCLGCLFYWASHLDLSVEFEFSSLADDGGTLVTVPSPFRKLN